MSRRRVRPEELELWSQIARSAKPLPGKLKSHRVTPPEPVVASRPAQPTPAPASVSPFSLGAKAADHTETHYFPRTTADHLHAAPVNMDHKAYQRLKRGKLTPDARIDLHGMTLDRAHPALTRFIMGAHAKGYRLVLVITGKGSAPDPYDPAPRQRGVLRQQVPMWLQMAPLSAAVLQITPAHQRHGGAGAYYVYLRRAR